MKDKLMKIFFAPLFGVLSVLIIIILFNIIVNNGNGFTNPDNGFFQYFVPAMLFVSIFIQIVIVIPLLAQYKIKGKIMKLSLYQFVTIICLISGFAFGLLFYERGSGFYEFLGNALTGIVAFSLYWLVNIIILKRTNY